MLNRLLPRHADNAYQGRKTALWLFALAVLLKSAIGFNSTVNGYDVAVSADGIPLDTFAPDCARVVVLMLAAWGLAQLFISLLCVVILFRYRALVPFAFTLLLLEHLSRRLLYTLMHIERTAGTHPSFYVNLIITTLLVVGLVLSLLRRERRRAGESPAEA